MCYQFTKWSERISGAYHQVKGASLKSPLMYDSIIWHSGKGKCHRNSKKIRSFQGCQRMGEEWVSEAQDTFKLVKIFSIRYIVLSIFSKLIGLHSKQSILCQFTPTPQIGRLRISGRNSNHDKRMICIASAWNNHRKGSAGGDGDIKLGKGVLLGNFGSKQSL